MTSLYIITSSAMSHFSSEKIAEQITLVEAEHFRSIGESEFIISSMHDTFDREKVPNFAKAVEHFNDLTYWVQGIILSQHRHAQEQREKILWKVNPICLVLSSNLFYSIEVICCTTSSKMSKKFQFVLCVGYGSVVGGNNPASLVQICL